MIKAVALDADGVVVEDQLFSDKLAKKLNQPLDKILPFFKNEFMNCVKGEADVKTEIQKYFKSWGWQGPVDEIIKIWFDGQTQAKKKMLKIVNDLNKKGILTILATNQEKIRAEYLTFDIGLGELFDIIFSSCWVGFYKPEVEYFQALHQAVDLKPEEILFFDDRKKNVQSAKAIGYQAFQYTDFKEFKKTLEKHL